jgi:hypothetical protein
VRAAGVGNTLPVLKSSYYIGNSLRAKERGLRGQESRRKALPDVFGKALLGGVVKTWCIRI